MQKSNSSTRQHAHHRVVRLRVTGGFLGGVDIELADGLNCFIGGRGAGKTTALEFLRYGLGLMPDAKASPQRFKALDSLVQANLRGGRLNIELKTKAEMLYTARRAVGESVEVLNEQGVAVPVTLDRDHIFSADVFSQNQIEEIASNPNAQLDLLDRFQEQASTTISRELAQLDQELQRSNDLLRRLDEEMDALRAKASEASAIEERLRGLMAVAGPDAERMNSAHGAQALRAREQHLFQIALDTLARLATSIAEAEAGFAASIRDQFDEAVRTGENGDILRSLESELSSLQAAVGQALDSIRSSSRSTESAIRRWVTALEERHAVQGAAYRDLLEQSKEEGGRAAERASLQASLAASQAAAIELRAKERQRGDVTSARRALTNRVSELRDDRYLLRKRVAERLTQQFTALRVSVAQAADLQAYRELLAARLKGVGVKQGMAAERISEVLLPAELAALLAANDVRAIEDRCGFEAERARKIVDALRADGGAYDIEIVDIEDRPCIELRDGEQYKESPRLSTGQRCTTILPILLVQNERPLLIDQPEDNLDNAFVYDTIVTALRAVKGSRQVILVTHNPNIPVLGEAERVFVFASDGQNARVQSSGTVDDCKDLIERILEGGREAFLERKTRYGH